MPVWIKGGIGLILGLGQILLIGFWLAHPHVNAMYREFYLSGTRDCWLPDDQAAQSREALAKLTSYSPGDLTAPEACYLLMKGWDGYNAGGAMSVSENEWLDLPAPPGMHHVALTFSGLIPYWPMKIRFHIDGKAAGELITPRAPGQASASFTVPAGDSTDMTVELDPHYQPAAHGIVLTHIAWAP